MRSLQGYAGPYIAQQESYLPPPLAQAAPKFKKGGAQAAFKNLKRNRVYLSQRGAQAAFKRKSERIGELLAQGGGGRALGGLSNNTFTVSESFIMSGSCLRQGDPPGLSSSCTSQF